MEQNFSVDTIDFSRLDVFLAQKLALSRSQTQRIIKAKMVRLNGKIPRKPGETIKIGDIVTLQEETESVSSFLSQKIEELPLPQIEIVSETDDYVIVNKPAGVLVHPTEAGESGTLVHWLLNRYPEIKNVGESEVRPGIMHRLDKEASGLLVIAKNQLTYKHLKNQFQKRKVKKEYKVLVHGNVESETGTIDFSVDRGPDGRMVARPKVDELALKNVNKIQPGKKALTEFWVEKHFVESTYLTVRIHTGRRHQIRVHFFAYNHPVVGDILYFQKKFLKFQKHIKRLFLHAHTLGFTDRKKKWIEVTAPLPKELEKYLETQTLVDVPPLIILSAPSGAGKNTVLNHILERIPGSGRLLTTTTRAPREGEVQDVDYHFIGKKEFQELLKQRRFVEHNEYAGEYYGLERAQLDKALKKYKIVFAVLDVNGRQTFKELGISHTAVFLMPESKDILRERIQGRGEVPDGVVAKRLAIAEDELAEAKFYDYQVVNRQGKLQEAVEDMEKVVREVLDKNGSL